MKHINITNWQGNITDWTKFNYIYGGLDETIADRVNLSIPGTNLRNYFRKSNNLINASTVSTTRNGITFSYNKSTDTFSYSGTLTSTSAYCTISVLCELVSTKTYTFKLFDSIPSKTRVQITAQGVADNGTIIGNSANYVRVKNLDIAIPNSIMFFIQGGTVGEEYNGSFKLMVTEGSTVPTTYEPYGSMVLVENVGTVDLGTLTWSKQTDGAAPYFRASLTDVASSTLNVSCPKLETVAWSTLYNSTIDKCCAIYYSQYILVRDNNYETAEAFKTAMSGVYANYELAEPKVTVSRQVVFNGSENWENRPYYNAADRFVLNWNLPRGAGGFTNWNGFNYMVAMGETLPNNFPYICNNNGSQIVINFSAKGTTTLEQFKEYLSNHPLIITYFPPSSNANMLGMVSPTQLTNSMSMDELLTPTVEEPANEER